METQSENPNLAECLKITNQHINTMSKTQTSTLTHIKSILKTQHALVADMVDAKADLVCIKMQIDFLQTQLFKQKDMIVNLFKIILALFVICLCLVHSAFF